LRSVLSAGQRYRLARAKGAILLKLFGTDGIRGEADRHPLDAETVYLVGSALVTILGEELGRPPRILIGRDTRESGPRIETWLEGGASASGAACELAGVMTTPGVAYITRTFGFDAGVVISASHNPYNDNGIKVFSSTGSKPDPDLEHRIEARVASLLADNTHRLQQRLEPGIASVDSHAPYLAAYLKFLLDDVAKGLSLNGMRLGIDCANGAGSEVGPLLFKKLGADISLIAASPNGRNINEGCGSTDTAALKALVVDNGLDGGIALDGDADRALFVDETGSVFDGDNILLTIGADLKKRGRLTGDTVVATVMSNVGLEIALRDRGIRLVRAEVGDRYVLNEMLARGSKLGGEQSGHVILTDISLAGDGLITAIEVLRVLRQSGRGLADHARDLVRHPQILINVEVGSKPPIESLPTVVSAMREVEGRLQDEGRLLVRYSGTQPLARVMIEGKDRTEIERLAQFIAEAIRKVIG
jgi:phosphoglucosamine mutase